MCYAYSLGEHFFLCSFAFSLKSASQTLFYGKFLSIKNQHAFTLLYTSAKWLTGFLDICIDGIILLLILKIFLFSSETFLLFLFILFSLDFFFQSDCFLFSESQGLELYCISLFFSTDFFVGYTLSLVTLKFLITFFKIIILYKCNK